MRIRTAGARVLLVVAAVAMPLGSAFAQQGLDPEKVKVAAEEYDSGSKAYKAKDYSRAAEHFETAFRQAPSPSALRMAIRASRQGGELARAATLSVRGQALFPDDRETVELAQSVIREASKKLQKVTVQCEPACTLTLDGRLVRDDAATALVIYTTSGPHAVVAGWGKNRSVSKNIEATEAGSMVVELVAPEEPEPVVAPSVSAPPVVIVSTASARPEPSPAPKLAPTFFAAGATVTVVLGGLMLWSGLDTQANPGPDAVREACAGQGASCPEYQEGLSKQTRTNVLLAATLGAGVVTGVLGAFFTDWSRPVWPVTASSYPHRGRGVVGAGRGPTIGISPDLLTGGGAAVTATGKF